MQLAQQFKSGLSIQPQHLVCIVGDDSLYGEIIFLIKLRAISPKTVTFLVNDTKGNKDVDDVEGFVSRMLGMFHSGKNNVGGNWAKLTDFKMHTDTQKGVSRAICIFYDTSQTPKTEEKLIEHTSDESEKKKSVKIRKSQVTKLVVSEFKLKGTLKIAKAAEEIVMKRFIEPDSCPGGCHPFDHISTLVLLECIQLVKGEVLWEIGCGPLRIAFLAGAVSQSLVVATDLGILHSQ